MINALRKRMMGTIMLFVSVILLVTFLAIFVLSYARVHQEITEKASSDERVYITTQGELRFHDEQIENAYVVNRIAPALGVHFNITADTQGRLLAVDSVLDFDADVYESALALALSRPDGGIANLEGRTWRYLSGDGAYVIDDGAEVAEEYPIILIRFLDITDACETLQTLAVILILLYGLLLCVFAVLSRHFAALAVRPMEQAWENQRQFVADVSHELKTPISTLHANLDILEACGDATIASQQTWLDNSKAVLHRMMALIQRMLTLAQFEEATQGVPVETVWLEELLDEVADAFAPHAARKQISILQQVETGVFVKSNYEMVQQVLEILMDNAVQYTDIGGEIRLCARRQRNDVILMVVNTGEGIAPEALDKVFDRFYRADAARVYAQGNYGLGLAIARAVTTRLGGAIVAESNAQCTQFTIRLPYEA